MTEKAKPYVELRRRAMDYLARREHSRFELSRKLMEKFPDFPQSLLDAVLDKLEDDKLLSDSRFAEAYVRYRRNKGFGPLHIQQELRRRQVSVSVIEEVLDPADELWWEAAQQLFLRKHGPGTPPRRGSSEYQKLHRFFISRGFSPSQIDKLWH